MRTKSCMRLAAVATAALVTTGAVGFAAIASELKMPKDHPQVALDVPDGWTVDRSSFAVEMRAPEKNSIVVASVLTGGKTALDGWTRQAGEKLKAFGVQFDTKAKAPDKPAKADEAAKAPDASSTSAFTTSPDAFTFSGTPSLKTPGTEGSNKQVKPGELSVEALTGLGKDTGKDLPKDLAPMPKLPFKAVQIFGTTMNGKPVDVQVLVYTLPSKHLFVMMQESGSDDGRAVAMARSVRGAK